MRPRRPYIATLSDVTVERSGESATIVFRDPAVLPVVLTIGPDIHHLDDADILEQFNAHLRAAHAETEGRQHVVVEIPRGRPQLEYSTATGELLPRGAVLRCLLDEGPDRDLIIHVDDHELTLEEFGEVLRVYVGWGMRVVFVDDDESDPPVVEVRDLEDGEGPHAWR